MYDLKCQKTHISAISSAQVSQSVFLAYLTVLRLITTVWLKMSEISHLHHFSAQISQIVFFAYLAVFQLIITLRPKMSENSYLRHFSAQSITKRFLSLFDRFTILLQLYDLKCQKTHISANSVHEYHKSCS